MKSKFFKGLAFMLGLISSIIGTIGTFLDFYDRITGKRLEMFLKSNTIMVSVPDDYYLIIFLLFLVAGIIIMWEVVE